MILLDTHVVVWMLTDDERLSHRAHETILQARRRGEQLGYSPVSLYEIVYAVGRNRMQLNSPVKNFVAAIESKLDMIPLTANIVICAADIPAPFHGDPMDRIITATAIVENCTLITHDNLIRKANLCMALW